MNDKHCELLLAFLDALECWSENPYSDHLILLAGKTAWKLQDHLCGLLHICFLAWESLANDPRPAPLPEVWNRTANTDHLLLEAYKFQNILEHNADWFATQCVAWIHKFCSRECLPNRAELHRRYTRAFETMNGFVSHTLSINVHAPDCSPGLACCSNSSKAVFRHLRSSCLARIALCL